MPVSNFGPYTHSVVASASGPNGTGTVDVSGNGFDPDVNGNGIPNEDDENRPTFVSMASHPAIGVAKTLTDLRPLVDGFEASFNVVVRNTGDVSINNLQIVEDLEAAFVNAEVAVQDIEVWSNGAFLANTNFDGIQEVNLLADDQPELAPGKDFVVSYTIAVVPEGVADVFETQAVAKALDQGGNELIDLSNDGTDPDPNGNGIASESGEDRPTIVNPSFDPSFYLSAHVDQVIGDTSRFEVQLSFALENTGAVALDSLNMFVDLANVFPGANINVVDLRIIAGESLPLNFDYDGQGVVRVFDAQGVGLSPGEAGRVKMVAEIIPGVDFGPYEGEIEVSGVTTKGEGIFDFAYLPPIRVATSTGKEAGLESNGDLSTLISARNYKQQHASWMTSAAKKPGISPAANCRRFGCGWNGKLNHARSAGTGAHRWARGFFRCCYHSR